MKNFNEYFMTQVTALIYRIGLYKNVMWAELCTSHCEAEFTVQPASFPLFLGH